MKQQVVIRNLPKGSKPSCGLWQEAKTLVVVLFTFFIIKVGSWSLGSSTSFKLLLDEEVVGNFLNDPFHSYYLPTYLYYFRLLSPKLWQAIFLRYTLLVSGT